VTRHRVHFPGCNHGAVELADGARLSEHLHALNSPLLFGCRMGICGTCLVEIDPPDALPPPAPDEADALALYAPGNRKARLACQIALSAPIAIVKIRAA
jgi:ferredoxin